MSDSFNPHEILSRLRSNNKGGSGGGGNGIPAAASTPVVHIAQSPNVSSSQQQPSAAKEKFIKATKVITASLALNNQVNSFITSR